jgi:branched-chain amino acid aminotransferase
MASSVFIQANTNGRLHRADEPAISPLNRGFLYGDAVYEVWRTYGGVIFAWEEHWARLLKSAEALYFTLPFTAVEMLVEIRRTCAAYRSASDWAGELYIRLQVSRGCGPIGLDTKLADHMEFTLFIQPCPVLSTTQLEEGQSLSVALALRRNPVEALNPRWKTGNYLNNLLCLREAKARGADEVVILNLAGEITEAAVCNLGFVRGGEILTPPMRAGILGGITRGLLLGEIAARAGFVAREASVYPSDLSSLNEVFLLSTTKDLQPVGAIDTYRYRTGAGTITRRVKEVFAAYAAEQASRWQAERQV